jgi:ComF family protein
VLYPRRCPLCDGVMGIREGIVCGDCRKKVHFLQQPLCMRCGRPLADDTEEFCPDCRDRCRFFIRGFAPFAYEGDIRDSILRLKYGHRAEYAKFYARAAAVFGRDLLLEWNLQAIIPIPVHLDRKIRRGYNQAECFATELSKITGIPVLSALRRVHSTRPQKELGSGERRRNLVHAFRADPRAEVPERVLIADDIFTTGATVDAAAAVLMRAGAEKIYFVCASIAPG